MPVGGHVPDWGHTMHAAGASLLYRLARRPHGAALLPTGLDFAQRDGRPDLSLTVRRSQGVRDDGKISGLLAVRLITRYPDIVADDALAATFGPVHLTPVKSGYLRLLSLSAAVDLPPDLTEPAELPFSGAGAVQWLSVLDDGSTQVLAEILETGTFGLSAFAEVEISGLSPRLPLRATVDVAALVSDLDRRSAENGALSDRHLLDAFSFPLGAHVLDVEGVVDAHPPELVRDALADRARAYLAELAPAKERRQAPALRLNVPDAPDTVTWRLDDDLIAARVFALDFDLFTMLPRQTGRDGGYVHRVTIPALPTGARTIQVSPNLPPNRRNVFTMGAHIVFPPRAPERPQAVHRTVEFGEADDVQIVTVALSPGEPLAFEFETFALLLQDGQVRELHGAPRAWDSPILIVPPDAFPVRFLIVRAAAALVREADVSAVWQARTEEGTVEGSVPLSEAAPEAAIPVPWNIVDGALSFQARPKDGGRAAKTAPMALDHAIVSASLFEGYGPHEVTLEVPLAEGMPPVAIEVVAEAAEEGAEPTPLLFTADRPRRTWRWFARSPFQPGFRYRRLASGGEIPDPWRLQAEPTSELVVDLEGVAP